MEPETVKKPEIEASERIGKAKTPRAARGGIKSISRTSSKSRRLCKATGRAKGGT